MGTYKNLTIQQKRILDKVGQYPYFQERFYFTGGTALSAAYLHHRYSEDLDFFSEKKLENEIIFTFMEELRKKLKFEFASRFVDVGYFFYLTFPDKTELKVDFVYYPYQRAEKGLSINGFTVDSKMDIAINKLLTISQRTEEKDFVDLYFLLKEFTFWDLFHGVRFKFGIKNDPYFYSTDFMKATQFTSLPKTIKPLTLDELKSFYTEKAKEIAKRSVE